MADGRELATQNWRPGERISRGLNTLEVVEVRVGSDEKFLALVVKSIRSRGPVTLISFAGVGVP